MQSDTKEVELSYATMRYEKPIVHIVFKENVELGFPEIRELTSYAEKLSGNKPYFAFSDVRSKVSVTQEGRRVASDLKAAPLCMGSAVLVNSSMFQLAANFFNKKPRYPFQVFIDKQKAVDWLLKLPIDTPLNEHGK